MAETFKIVVVPRGKKTPVLLDYEFPRQICQCITLKKDKKGKELKERVETDHDHPELLDPSDVAERCAGLVEQRIALGFLSKRAKYDLLITESLTGKTEVFEVQA